MKTNTETAMLSTWFPFFGAYLWSFFHVQEGLMIKAERMKKKMGLGRGELITIETIKVHYTATVRKSNKFNPFNSRTKKILKLINDEVCV